jgi:hypothetical protein
MKTLEQISKSNTFKFEIDDAGLFRKVISKKSETEFHIPFEKISSNRSFVSLENKNGLWIGLVFLLLTIVLFVLSFKDNSIEKGSSAIWLTASVICFIVYFNSKEKKVLLFTTENKSIEFLGDKPSREIVDEFINELIKERNTTLNSKYGQPTKLLEFTPQLENFNWLLNARVISKAEYEQKVLALNSLFNSNSSNNQIGFASNS